MNFFKSVFADDPEPKPESDSSQSNNNQDHPDSISSSKDPNSNPNPSGWSFGGLIQTLSAKSESVLETYRRDLKEFGSGLKKEIEVAHGSIETVSHVIDEFGNSVIKGTAQIIAHGKDAILAIDHESDSSDTNNERSYQQNLSPKRYSRFDAQVRAIQGDVNTYCEEVEDLEDYKNWKLGFVLEGEEIESLIGENGAMESMYQRVVPGSVDHETFWCRYFYKVYKLKQAEEVRASLVKRAISREEDEELTWDVEDDDEEEEEEEERILVSEADLKGKENVGSEVSGEIVKDNVSGVGSSIANDGDVEAKGDLSKTNKEVKIEESGEIHKVGTLEVVDEKGEKVDNVEIAAKGNVDKSSGENSDNERVKLDKSVEMSKEVSVVKSDKKVALEGKAETGDSSKHSDVSVVSSQPPMPEEEDLGWDEIEDLNSIDEKNEKKVTQGGSPNRADLRKRISAAEEEEDLSWDIEDDDEPVKA
ncbi:BSD domain-containing protein [Cephalotus follicularis]|uniref:BSD domain-containing protein n=1 Tax=Cephalotus follicularis TaxID=3775 RepID=A0A1Q3CF56_CEPFO|nr:BSD domain-containing protein [Cephalotus follicularis]